MGITKTNLTTSVGKLAGHWREVYREGGEAEWDDETRPKG